MSFTFDLYLLVVRASNLFLGIKIDEINTLHEGKCFLIASDKPFSPNDDMVKERVNLKLPDGINDPFLVYFKDGLDVANAAMFAMSEEEDVPKYHISPMNYYRFNIR